MLVGDVRRAAPTAGSTCTLSGGREFSRAVTIGLKKAPRLARQTRERAELPRVQFLARVGGRVLQIAQQPGASKNRAMSASEGSSHAAVNSPGTQRMAPTRQAVPTRVPPAAASAEVTQSSMCFFVKARRKSVRATAPKSAAAVRGQRRQLRHRPPPAVGPAWNSASRGSRKA